MKIRATSALLAALLAAFLAAMLLTPAHGVELKVDGWSSGQNAAFQGGFIAGEIAAVRLDPGGAGPFAVTGVTFLFGGDTLQREITLHIWGDSPASFEPGSEIFSGTFQVQGANDQVQFIDLSANGVFVSGPFRVGIEMLSDGLPGPARDDDGNISASDNFILASGFGWLPSNLLGLTGDFIIRAEVELQGDLTQEFKNDSWPPTVEVGYQEGFAAGESAAVRVVPQGPCPCSVNGVGLLFGGASGTRDAVLRIWEDDGTSVQPGAEIYSGTHPLTGANAVINVIDLSSESISVDGPFRFGFEFNHPGLPSVARDTDGITPDSNFINDNSLGWQDSSFFGLQGDWIMRAAVGNQLNQISELGIDDWAPIAIAAFQEGFAGGETAASRIEADFPCPCRVDRVRLLFGGTSETANVVLRVWEDSQGTDVPGTEVHSANLSLDGNNLVLNDIELTSQNIWVNGPFRIGVEFVTGGLPSIARDHDGIVPGRNFIQLEDSSWADSTTQGLTGDWILRSVVYQEVLSRIDFEAP